VVQNGEQVLPGPQLIRHENNQGNWMEQMRGSLMVVATVMASLTFQIAINPPGGVWQSKADADDGCGHDRTCNAGTSVLASGDGSQKLRYEVFILLCAISFSASQTIIVLLISGFSLRNKCLMWLLTIVTCLSVLCTGGAYVCSMLMILDPLEGSFYYHITLYYAYFWVGLIVLLILIFFCRFVFWLLKKFFRRF